MAEHSPSASTPAARFATAFGTTAAAAAGVRSPAAASRAPAAAPRATAVTRPTSGPPLGLLAAFVVLTAGIATAAFLAASDPALAGVVRAILAAVFILAAGLLVRSLAGGRRA